MNESGTIASRLIYFVLSAMVVKPFLNIERSYFESMYVGLFLSLLEA
jgi:hypothetical protein